MNDHKKQTTLNEQLMRHCIELAHQAAASHNYPLGALVAIGDTIIAEAGSTLVQVPDPTAHPEMVVIREAARKLSSRFLPEATLYTTLEPCPMCTSAALWGKMKGIVFGSSQEEIVAWTNEHPNPSFSWRQIPIKSETIVRASKRLTTVEGGILKAECHRLFSLT